MFCLKALLVRISSSGKFPASILLHDNSPFSRSAINIVCLRILPGSTTLPILGDMLTELNYWGVIRCTCTLSL